DCFAEDVELGVSDIARRLGVAKSTAHRLLTSLRSRGLAERPIVAKSRGGVGEFVSEGTEGLLATSDRDMARAIARLVDSPSLRWAMREHNGAVAPAFGWDDAMVRTQQLYARAEELAGRPASVSPAASVRVAVDAEALR
ncbi:MAG: helix-turn-helix domain-containing protein, partial [Actinomycetes bacterium]